MLSAYEGCAVLTPPTEPCRPELPGGRKAEPAFWVGVQCVGDRAMPRCCTCRAAPTVGVPAVVEVTCTSGTKRLLLSSGQTLKGRLFPLEEEVSQVPLRHIPGTLILTGLRGKRGRLAFKTESHAQTTPS